jgi:pimeloyl-ACP methyl ester carboxylesterase
MQVLVRNDDAQIDVRVDGNGATTVVLIHGFPFTGEIWDAQARVLAERYRVVRPDLRGMGRSRVIDGPYLMEALAGDIAAVLDTLGVERAAIAGHSLGGFVALAFARMYAERVERLALICSRVAPDSPERAAWRNETADSLEKSGSIADVCDAMIAACVAPERYAGDPDLVARAREIAMRNEPKGLAAMLRGMALRSGSEDIAPDLEVPVLVVAGGHDPSQPLDEARSVARHFRQARFELCEASGHLPMLEEPARLTDVLAGFL